MKPHMQDKPENYQTVIEQLVAQRKSLGISQEEMSYRLNVSERLINNWECGFKQPSSHMLFKWLAALGGMIRFSAAPFDPRDLVLAFPVSEKRKSAYELIDFICSTHAQVCFEDKQVQSQVD